MVFKLRYNFVHEIIVKYIYIYIYQDMEDSREKKIGLGNFSEHMLRRWSFRYSFVVRKT